MEIISLLWFVIKNKLLVYVICIVRIMKYLRDKSTRVHTNIRENIHCEIMSCRTS